MKTESKLYPKEVRYVRELCPICGNSTKIDTYFTNHYCDCCKSPFTIEVRKHNGKKAIDVKG